METEVLLMFSEQPVKFSYAEPNQPFTDEAQTALFKDPVRTAL